MKSINHYQTSREYRCPTYARRIANKAFVIVCKRVSFWEGCGSLYIRDFLPHFRRAHSVDSSSAGSVSMVAGYAGSVTYLRVP